MVAGQVIYKVIMYTNLPSLTGYGVGGGSTPCSPLPSSKMMMLTLKPHRLGHHQSESAWQWLRQKLTISHACHQEQNQATQES